MRRFLRLLVGCLIASQCLSSPAPAADADVVVIANASVPPLDAPLLARLYTGRAVEVGSMPVTVVNAAPGNRTRDRFLSRYLQQDDEKYRAYWTVRRHVGKGIPPREFDTTGEIIDFVQKTPGAIGYIEAGDLKPGLRVLLRP